MRVFFSICFFANIFLWPLLLPGQEDFALSLSDGLGVVDGSATVAVTLAHDASDIRGFHFGVCHDSDMLSLEEEDLENGSGMENGPSVETHVFEVLEDGWTVASLWCVPCDSVMMPSGEYELVVATYTLLEAGTADLDFCGDLGDPAVTIRIVDVDGDDEIVPDTASGAIVVRDNEFLRGDADSSGQVAALVDALFVLRWAFLDEEAPACEDAVDVDDDGALTPLTEAIRLLLWQFGTSVDPPEDPGPEVCGPDPTEDALECEETADECE